MKMQCNKVVVLLVQGMMLSIVWRKGENCLTIVIICLQTIYLQPMLQQTICWNKTLLWSKQWDEISYSIYQTKLLLLSRRLRKKFMTRRRDTLPCHISKSNLITSALTFCGAFDVPHRKKADKTIPVIVDMYSQSMGL